MSSHFFFSLVFQPTRVTEKSKTLIDVLNSLPNHLFNIWLLDSIYYSGRSYKAFHHVNLILHKQNIKNFDRTDKRLLKNPLGVKLLITMTKI